MEQPKASPLPFWMGVLSIVTGLILFSFCAYLLPMLLE